MKAVFRFTGLVFFVAALIIKNAHAEENCNAWRTADVDPTAGKYLIELRTCDLTYGLSAYVQIKNSSDERLNLSYRIITKDDKSRDEETILEPGSTTRAANCQACAKRHAGFKSWELLSVKTLAKAPEVKTEAATQTNTDTGLPATPALKEAKPVEPAPVAAESPPVENNAKSQTSTQTDNNSDAPKNTEKKREFYKAEDGTEIPYDQLPPEFRPRK